jgi:hypothetical protein
MWLSMNGSVSTAPALPCARGISTSLYVIDVRNWQPEQPKSSMEANV